MQSSAPNSSLAELDIAVNDLGPLAWVLDELRKSLDGSAKALKRFVRDAEAARGSDLAALDASHLRIARQQLHQAVGALEMVGLAGPALVLRAMEAAVQRFLAQPEQCTPDAAGRIERASFALTEYLEAVLAGRPISAVSLFPQYRAVQELVKADRVHPADLWSYEWRWLTVELPAGAAPLAYDDAARAILDRSVLPLMKGANPQAAADMRALCLGLAAGVAADESHARIFWTVSAAYFEALAHGVLQADLYVRRAASRVLMQYTSLSRGDSSISERLVQDLLFFCAQSVSPRAAETPVLSAVRAAYSLSRFKPVDYELVQFGRFDPALLAQARKRIASAKETWSSLSAGELGKFKSVADQFSLVTDSLQKLHPPSEPLAQALNRAIDTTVRSNQAPGIELAMEVATSVLYLEAAFDDLDPADPQLVLRTTNLADRLEGVRSGGAPQPLEAWMEELYRRVSDKHTMGSVVGELRVSLGELEKSLDLFFRNPQDKANLQPVPGQLSQMRGVLSVLGLDQASQAVARMRESVEEMLVTEIDEQKARATGTFEHLGNNLGALSFLIDMLNYQPALAKKLFVYDEAKGELQPLMGRTAGAASAAAAVSFKTDTLSQEVLSAVQAADEGRADAQLSGQLDALATHAALADQPALAKSAREASAAVHSQDAEATREAMSSLGSSLATVQESSPATVPADDLFEEDDLKDIFLEEAREVIGHGLDAVKALDADAADSAQLTVLRRAFHTLKGSSRMVGLNTFGEAAWAMEQLLNTWLADQKDASDDFRALCAVAMDSFEAWVGDIATGQDLHWSAAPFVESAEAMCAEERYVALLPQTSPAMPTAALAASAVAAVPAADADPVDAAVEWPAEAATLQEAVIEAFVFDLASPADSPIPATGPAEPEREPEPAAETAADPVTAGGPLTADSDFDFGFDFDVPAASANAAAAPADDAENAPLAGAEPVTALAEDDGFDLFFKDVPASAPTTITTTATTATTAAAMEIEGIDFDSLSALSAHPDATASTYTVAEEAPLSPIEVAMPATTQLDDADFDALFDSGLAPLETPSAEASTAAATAIDTFEPFEAVADAASASGPAEPSAPSGDEDFIDFGELAALSAQPEALQSEPLASANLDAQVQALAADAQPADPFEAHADGQGGEDQVKVIGALRIGIPLYNVYLNEADEWSRRLVTEIAEWAFEGHHPVSESTEALAHSLAGSSATVGFQALSDISRALEHALQQSRAHHSHGAGQYGQLFVDASEDIRRLLHQFAAGFLKQADPQLLQRLHDLEFNDSISPPAGEITDADIFGHAPPAGFHDDEAHDGEADSFDSTDLSEAPGAGTTADVQTAFTSDASLAPEPAARPTPAVPAVRLVWPQQAPLQPAPRQAGTAFHSQDYDESDEIDAVDAIDPDLFAIFEEEGAELMPQLGAALRQWSARPDNLGARLEVLRVLHTLKGSARLAGAMRLGEMAHRVETEIEHVGSDAAATQEFEPLLNRFDAMQVAFEGLRHPDEAAADAEEQGRLLTTSSPSAETPSDVPPDVQPDVQPPAIHLVSDGDAGSPAVDGLTVAPAGRNLSIPAPQAMAMQPLRQAANASVRVRSQLLDRMVNQAGEVMITRSRLEAELGNLRGSLNDMNGNLNRLRQQLRDIELQAETQMQSRLAQAKEAQAGFDPLEFDRFTRVQELTRMMAESVNDVATVQRTLQRTVEATEDDLIAQARQTRELQRDLLRTRMVEFEGISERLYRVVRQASKETGKQVRLDLLGGTIEMDRGMLDRLTPAFEHLLRNCVAHGIEAPERRTAGGKDPVGLITVHLRHEGNDVSVDFSDDGAGLDLARIREKAQSAGMLAPGQILDDSEAANLIFMPGFSTATQVTELAGRGIGMDVVRTEITAIGGRIETSTVAGQGTHFKLVLPLTTAVTQVVMIRAGNLSVGVPANVVETVRRATAKELQQAYNSGTLDVGGEAVPFFWSGALLQASHQSAEPQGRTTPVVVFRSAAQRMALHVDEVLGNQEVVVKNLGPQLSRLPGLAGMSVLASGAVVLIYNPVALASVYGEQARAWSTDRAEPHVLEAAGAEGAVGAGRAKPMVAAPAVPLILVVDDSITVRRVTQRLLQREGYRVAMAADGLQALERLQEEVPSVVLSDIEMPRMDGFDLARNIRADSRLAKLPIVMITSRIAEKHREHARELGVDHYLGKPYSEEELISLVRHYCAAEAAAST